VGFLDFETLRNKGLIWPYIAKPMVYEPLIRTVTLRGGGWLISHNFLNHLFHPQGTGQQLQEIQNNPLALSLSDQEPVSEGRPSTEAPPSFNDLRHMRPLIIHLGSSGCGCGSKTRCYWEPQNDVISRKSSKIIQWNENEMLLICFQDSLECDGTFFSDFGYGWIWVFFWMAPLDSLT